MDAYRLDHAECLALLARVPVGRLVFTDGGLPAVHPVTFVLDGDTIVFCADDDRERAAAERGDVVAFQVDEIDAERYHGWTVTAIGHCLPVPETARLVPLRSWDASDHPAYVRVMIESIQGRLLSPVRRVAGVRRQVPS